MIYVCLYNSTDKVIVGDEAYDRADDAENRYQMYVVEAQARAGTPWTAYIGDKPFEFPQEAVQ